MSRLYATGSPRPRLAWLLWCLVLLAPLMQTATTWHGLSHGHLQTADSDEGKPALHKLHCDFCLTAAALSDGAAAARMPSVQRPPALHALPPTVLLGVALSAPAQAYESRAPPLHRL